MTLPNSNSAESQKSPGSDKFDRFMEVLVTRLDEKAEKRQTENFIERMRDKIEAALANVIVWGGAVVVGWAVIYVFVGKGEIKDMEEAAILREAKIDGKVEAVKTEVTGMKSSIDELIKAIKNMNKKPKTAAKPISPLKPDFGVFEQRQMQAPNAAQHSWDYLEKHSRRNKK